MIPYGRQDLDEDDIQAVEAVLRSDWLTQGPFVAQFEADIASYVGAKFAVAVTNATSALHIAMLGLELGPGKRLWTSPNTFVASANCGLYCGAEVDFVDINPNTYNMDVTSLEQKLELAHAKGKLPDVVVPVHFSGQSCDMRQINELSRHYGFNIVEDGAHAIGGRYLNAPIGNCRFSDATIFSFHPVKIITTAEGGVVTTNNEVLYRKLLRLRNHGVVRNQAEMQGQAEGAWYYQQVDLGFNYRMTDLQAALGSSQIKKLDQFVARRAQLVKQYHELFKGLPLTTPFCSEQAAPSWHLYVIRLDNKEHRKPLFDYLREQQVGVNVHYIPVHTQPWYRKMGFKSGDFPNAEDYYQRVISLPLHTRLTDDQQLHIVNLIKSWFKREAAV